VKNGQNSLNFPPKINNDNFNSNNTLDGFNFDSENTCKDMLEQVKKVVEYNTNFINRNNQQNNYNENKIDNDLNLFSNNRNNKNNYISSNSLYSNSNNSPFTYKNNNQNYGIENNVPINIGSVRNNSATGSHNLNKLLNKNFSNNLENNFQNKFKVDSLDNYPVNNPNLNQFLSNTSNNNTNTALSINLNYDPLKSNIYTVNPFKSAQNNVENNSNFNGVSTANFLNNVSTQIHEINNNEIMNKNSKVNGQLTNRTSRDSSRLTNINILQDYKLSLDGKINNLKKMINQKIGYSKFKNLSNDIFVNILNYFNTYDINSVMHMNSYMKNKILAILTDSSRIICQQFEKKFNNFFLLKNSQILISNIKKNRKLYSKINLVLRFQITDSNLKNKTVILGFLNKYYGESNNLKNLFRFDIRTPGPLSFWVMREYTSVKKIFYLILKIPFKLLK